MIRLFLGIWLAIVTLLAFVLPMSANPSAWYHLPIIPGLEDKARILFFHVPTAWLSTVGFIASMVYGIRYLRKRDPEDDIKSASAAGVGFLFCILATVTGAIWAKFSWGTYWNWDPRQTSIFVLLLIYGAYFALRSAIDVEEKRATLSAAYAIIAAVVMPFFMFVMPRILASLHPQPVLNVQGKTEMNATMLVLLISSFAGFTGLASWMWNLEVRIQRIVMNSLSGLKGETRV
ncbi:MAG: cytochrome c biogenesis protein CcsA [Ignavibacteria bacterium]|nr:cytochrome c biogenesis protein CcsA [Ignavibacteria bacterium]